MAEINIDIVDQRPTVEVVEQRNEVTLALGGQVGPQGPQGEQGPAGPQGAASTVPGPQGPEGPAGPQGPAGADSTVPGPEGPAGPAGPQGPQGEQGLQGPTGLTGATGPKGDTGDTGLTGPEGPQGPQGIQGIPGNDGATGPAGADGAIGPQGPEGPQGIQGIQGIPGADGATGPAGADGATGPAGPGVPVGGTTGQVLAKATATDYDTEWIEPPAGTGGGSAIAVPDTTVESTTLILGNTDGGTAQQNDGLLALGQIIIPRALTFTSVAVHVTSPAAGATLSVVIGTREGSTWTKVFESSALDASSGGVKAETGLDVDLAAGVYWVGTVADVASPQVTRMGTPGGGPGFAYPFKGTITSTIDGPFVYASSVAVPVSATLTIADNTNAVQPALIRLGGVTYPALPTGGGGADGASAYEVAVANGFVGDETAWLASLVGEQGPQGIQGETGLTGDTGPQGIQGETGLTGPEGPQGIQGETGLTGATGPEGPQGIQGIQGVAGADGADGDSAYAVAVANGFVGTEAAWLASLVGEQGPQGIQGIQGETGPQGIQGIQGETGPAGTNGTNGTDGADGSTWLSGSGVPSTGIGVIDDHYFNTANGDVYKKTGASTWTFQVNLKGPTGATGASGITVSASAPSSPSLNDLWVDLP